MIICDLIRKYICPKDDILNDLFKLSGYFNGNDFIIFNRDEIMSIVKNKFQPNIIGNFYPKDLFYVGYPEEIMIEFNKVYSKYKPRYKSEYFDCDNFAIDYLVMLSRFTYNIPNIKYSFAIGNIMGNFSWVNNYHEINFYLTPNKEIYLFDPQTLKKREIDDTKIRFSFF